MSLECNVGLGEFLRTAEYRNTNPFVIHPQLEKANSLRVVNTISPICTAHSLQSKTFILLHIDMINAIFVLH